MLKTSINGTEAPPDLEEAIKHFFPEEEWQNAVDIAYLESSFNADACNATALWRGGCGARIESIDGVGVSAEFSVSYFQINMCNLPNWNIGAMFRAYDNVGTAKHMWQTRGWSPWYFSARRLGLL